MNSEKTSAFTTYNPTALQNLRAVNKPHKPDNVKTQHTKKSNSDFFITLDRQIRAAIIVRYKALKTIEELPSIQHALEPLLRYISSKKISIHDSGIQVTFVGNVTKARSSTFHYKTFINPNIFKTHLKPDRELEPMIERYQSDYIGHNVFEIYKNNKPLDDKIRIADDSNIINYDSVLLYGEPLELYQISKNIIVDFIRRYCQIFNTTTDSNNWFQISFIPFKMEFSTKIYWHIAMKIEEELFISILSPQLSNQFIEKHNYNKPNRQYD